MLHTDVTRFLPLEMDQKPIGYFEPTKIVSVEQIGPQGTVPEWTIDDDRLLPLPLPLKDEHASTVEQTEKQVSDVAEAGEVSAVAEPSGDDQSPPVANGPTAEQIKKELDDDRKHGRVGWGRMTPFNFWNINFARLYL